MKLIFRKFSPLCCLCVFAGCLLFTSCQDIVRRLDDKYRPVVPEPVRSVTVITDGIDSSGVPLRLINLEIADLELKATDAGGATVPFTPKLEADKTHEGLAYIRTPPNGNPTTEFSITVDICSKSDGTVYASHTFTADRFPWRVFKVDGETYKFELKKLYHCDNDMTLGTGSSPALFTGEDSGEAVAKDSILTLIDSKGREGTMITFFHDGSSFVQNGYDYFEIKFRSEANVESTVTLHGASSFTYKYDSGVCSATGGDTNYNTQYKDTDTDWVTLGFWNDIDSNSCLFLENWEGSVGTANQSSLSNAQNYTYMTVDTGVGQNADHATEIDYVAFFKRVEQ